MNEKKLFIETYGCQMNMADSEVVASIMKMADYSICENIEGGRRHFRKYLLDTRQCRTTGHFPPAIFQFPPT